MEEKPAIVCVGLPNWEGDYLKSTVQLMSELAISHKILYVEYTFTVNDILKGILKKSSVPVKRIIGITPRLRKIQLKNGGEIFVLTPPATLPINWINNKSLYKVTLGINGILLSQSIRSAMRTLGIKNPIVVNAFQPAYGLALKSKLGEKTTIYYCYDEISAAAWCKKHGAWTEKEFMQVADAVIVSSEPLRQTKSLIQPKCYLVKNGVDLAVFSQIVRDAAKPSQVVGYVGSVDDRLDIELLQRIVRSFSQYQFLFVGRIMDNQILQNFAQYPNIHFAGAKQPQELPEYLAKLDVGIIPFKKNEFTKNIYPLKINEYLASGMPVVTTDFADLSDFKEVVYLTDEQAFGQELKKALDEKNDSLRRKRIALAQQNAWSNRASEFSRILSHIESP